MASPEFAEFVERPRRGRDKSLADHSAYGAQCKTEFEKLLQAAKSKNLLYFLLNLYGWGAVKWSNRFVAQVNLITNRLLLDRNRRGLSEPIPPHEMILLLQLNLEAKAYYATLRNLVYIASGKLARPEPWDKSKGEYRCIRNRTISLSTGRLLSNLIGDLKSADFTWLADELRVTHVDSVSHIRNAIAHGTFLFPNQDTNNKWVFGTYAESGQGFVFVRPHEYTHNEFQDVCRRFFAFRLAFIDALSGQKARYDDTEFTFQAPNEMKPGELLACSFVRGSLRVKVQGAPLWPDQWNEGQPAGVETGTQLVVGARARRAVPRRKAKSRRAAKTRT